jgi:hypothetical protein
MQHHGLLLLVSSAFCKQTGTGQWNVNVTEWFEGVKHKQEWTAASRGKIGIDCTTAL